MTRVACLKRFFMKTYTIHQIKLDPQQQQKTNTVHVGFWSEKPKLQTVQ